MPSRIAKINVNLDPELKMEIDAQARATDRSRSAVIRILIKAGLQALGEVSG